MNIAPPAVPVFKDRIEKKNPRGVRDSEFTGISDGNFNPVCNNGSLRFYPDDNRSTRLLTECSSGDHSALSPTTWRIA